jgi:hypothetical protein
MCRKQFCLFWLSRAHRYRAVPSPGFKPTTLWLRVRRPNHSAYLKSDRGEIWYEYIRYPDAYSHVEHSTSNSNEMCAN